MADIVALVVTCTRSRAYSALSSLIHTELDHHVRRDATTCLREHVWRIANPDRWCLELYLVGIGDRASRRRTHVTGLRRLCMAFIVWFSSILES